MCADVSRQGNEIENFPHFPTTVRESEETLESRGSGRPRPGPQKESTEPVTPPSRSPTDRRRSDCRSENLQPRALRTRCKPQSRDPHRGRQDLRERPGRKLRLFLFARAVLRSSMLALDQDRYKERPDPRVRPQRFAEPGTLSSTFPTNVPLSRTAPRGASTYRRPVLGAGGTVGHSGHGWQDRRRKNSPQFASAV